MLPLNKKARFQSPAPELQRFSSTMAQLRMYKHIRYAKPVKVESPVAEGSYCKIFSASETSIHKIMPACEYEGFGPGQLRECNFYQRLPVKDVQQLIHGHVVYVCDSRVDPFSCVITMEMPKVFGDMAHVGKSPWWNDENVIKYLPVMVDDITIALSRCHASMILHRDIKPGNFLTDKEHFFLIDFGSSNLATVSTRSGGNCTYVYCAPEAGPNKKKSVDTVQTDIYSLAASIISLILRRFPLGDSVFDWHKLITKKKHSRVKWPEYAAPWIETLTRGVHKDPSQRPSLAEIRASFGLTPTPDLFNTPLPLKECDMPDMKALDTRMQTHFADWESAKKTIFNWISSSCQKFTWSKVTFLTSAQCLLDILLDSQLPVLQENDLQLLALITMSLSHKCLEDIHMGLNIMVEVAANAFTLSKLFLKEKEVLKRLDFVITRRKFVLDYENMSWDDMVEYVCRHGV
jgi:serine/threonine protein kinase